MRGARVVRGLRATGYGLRGEPRVDNVLGVDRFGFVFGILLALAGVVWMLQGMNARFVPQSFMTNNRAWVLYGAVAVVAGIAVLVWSRRQ